MLHTTLIYNYIRSFNSTAYFSLSMYAPSQEVTQTEWQLPLRLIQNLMYCTAHDSPTHYVFASYIFTSLINSTIFSSKASNKNPAVAEEPRQWSHLEESSVVA